MCGGRRFVHAVAKATRVRARKASDERFLIRGVVTLALATAKQIRTAAFMMPVAMATGSDVTVPAWSTVGGVAR